MDDIKTINFKKEGRQWYADLPEWKGRKGSLKMIAGAGALLSKLSADGVSASFSVSETEKAGFEKLTKVFDVPIFGGAIYKSRYWPMWLCNVTKFVFGHLPEKIYFKQQR